MKTILIIIAGMADRPDIFKQRETPLTEGDIPALDTLARRGELTVMTPIAPYQEFNHLNALLSIMGYDLDRGVPRGEELMEYGLSNNSNFSDFTSLHPFVIPGFSGHGVCITTSAWVRGVAKLAEIKPVDIYSPGASDTEILSTIANIANIAIRDEEFVFIYVDSPLKASLNGDFDAKVEALENIDSNLIAPIADFVWKSELLINMVVTTDLVTPTYLKQQIIADVPAIIYFNGDDWENYPDKYFNETQAERSDKFLYHPSDLIRYLSGFNDHGAPVDIGSNDDSLPF